MLFPVADHSRVQLYSNIILPKRQKNKPTTYVADLPFTQREGFEPSCCCQQTDFEFFGASVPSRNLLEVILPERKIKFRRIPRTICLFPHFTRKYRNLPEDSVGSKETAEKHKNEQFSGILERTRRELFSAAVRKRNGRLRRELKRILTV